MAEENVPTDEGATGDAGGADAGADAGGGDTPSTLIGGDPPAEPAAAEPAAEPAAAEPAAEPAAAEPEVIEYGELTMPEGYTLSEEGTQELHEFGKKNGLSQEALQAVVELSAQNVQDNLQAYDQHLGQNWTATREAWANEVKGHPELGGDNLPKTVADANTAIKSFGKMIEIMGDDGKPVLGTDGKPRMTNDVAQALEVTGAGDHPAIVRMFAQLGGLVGEGGVVHGNMSSAPKPLPQILFDKSNMNP